MSALLRNKLHACRYMINEIFWILNEAVGRVQVSRIWPIISRIWPISTNRTRGFFALKEDWILNIYTIFDGLAYNTRGYFASCVVYMYLSMLKSPLCSNVNRSFNRTAIDAKSRKSFWILPYICLWCHFWSPEKKVCAKALRNVFHQSS